MLDLMSYCRFVKELAVHVQVESTRANSKLDTYIARIKMVNYEGMNG